MAKSKPEGETKEERRARKDAKKAAKSTLSEDAGVTKSKSDKKDKKEKKKAREALADNALNEITNGESKKKSKKVKAESEEDEEEEIQVEQGEIEMKDEGDVENKTAKKGKMSLKDRPVGALVPFAHPLADEKVGKKVFRSVKKGTSLDSPQFLSTEAELIAFTAAAQRTLKRGVKEVVKALRKSPTSQPASSISADADTKDLPLGIVILAADISPMDVISHLPVLCEDHNIPYIFVTSRAELGMAGMTKRPTSVVMVSKDAGKKKDDAKKAAKDEDEEEWSETYKALVKVVLREMPKVRK